MANNDETMLIVKEKAKSMLKSYLESQGINTRKNFSCLSVNHEDKDPSMHYNEKTNTVYCFGCGEHGDIFDVIRMQYNIHKDDYKQIFETTYKILGINIDNIQETSVKQYPAQHKKNIQNKIDKPQEDLTEFFKKAETLINSTDYAKTRGLTEEVIKRFHLGFDPAWIYPHLNEEMKEKVKLSPRLIIPTSKHSYLARDTRADLSEKQKKYSKMKVGKVEIFNKEVIGKKSPIFIVEGEIDAMSIVVAGGEAVALGSASNVDLFLKECKNKAPSGPFIICADNDKIGKQAMARLSAGLIAEKIPFIFANISDTYKDANERLVNDAEGLRKDVAYAITDSIKMMKRLEQGIDSNKLVDEIYKKIADMKEEIISTKDYWQKVFTLLNNTINEVQQVQSGLRILKFMAAGVSVLEERLGHDTPKEALEIRKIAEEALRKNENKNLSWEKLLSLIDTMQDLTKKSMQFFEANEKMSPLLSLPKFRNAKPIQDNEILKKIAPKELYPRVIKKMIMENNKVTGIYEADFIAGKFLRKQGLNMTEIEKVLLHSPRIAHLSNEMKKQEIKYFTCAFTNINNKTFNKEKNTR